MLGINSGVDSILVLTGETTEEEIQDQKSQELLNQNQNTNIYLA